jgi:hypothetical protein
MYLNLNCIINIQVRILFLMTSQLKAELTLYFRSKFALFFLILCFMILEKER